MILRLRCVRELLRFKNPASTCYLFCDQNKKKGFEKFVRKNKVPNNDEKNNEKNNDEKNTESKVEDDTKGSPINNKQPQPQDGFQKFFKHNYKKTINDQNKGKQKQQTNKKQEQVHKSTTFSNEQPTKSTQDTQTQESKMKQSQNPTDETKKNAIGFEKFHILNKKKLDQDMKKMGNVFSNQNSQESPPQADQPKEQKKQENMSKMSSAENSQQTKEKPNKSPQQLEDQRAEQELQKKDEYFKKKIDEFKNMKNEEPSIKEFEEKVKKIRKKIGENLYKKTKINLDGQFEPPGFIKSNPTWNAIFMGSWRMKFFILIGLGFYILAKIQTYAPMIEAEQLLDYVENKTNQISSLAFLTVIEKIESEERSKKMRSYVLIKLTNKQKYQCVSNQEFEQILRKKLMEINSRSQHPIPIYTLNREPLNFLHMFRTGLIFLLTFLIFSQAIGHGKQIQKGMGKGGINNFFDITGGAKSRRFQQVVNVKFNDVMGMEKQKQQIVEFIDFLVNPEKYHRLGAKIPRGALLTGPPGTGKTMIAKACAGESSVPFFTISGSQFVEMYVGVGAQRVRDLFKEAKQAAPSIIFIDEIDAVGKKRSSGAGGGGHDERDNTLNQLLVEMDGFNTNTNVIVFAATNQKDVLDPALTRPGRFDRLIQIDLPDIEGRKQIFLVHLKPIVIDSHIKVEQYARRMATLTPGFSGADIKNLCNEAAIIAARNDSSYVSLHDFQMATERVIGGVQKKSSLITPETRKIVAYHQCGHGVCSWFLEGANPLLKLTIIPRSKGALGFAQYLPHESQISTLKQLQDQICVILGGRVSQQIFFKRISTGAYDDLQKVYQLAKMIVTQYGMNERLGWLKLEESEYTKHYSKETEKMIDEQILKIIKRCTEKTRSLLTEKQALISQLAERLLQKQTIDQTTISSVLGQRPFKPNKQYQEYLRESKKMSEESTTKFKVKASDYVI